MWATQGELLALEVAMLAAGVVEDSSKGRLYIYTNLYVLLVRGILDAKSDMDCLKGFSAEFQTAAPDCDMVDLKKLIHEWGLRFCSVFTID